MKKFLAFSTLFNSLKLEYLKKFLFSTEYDEITTEIPTNRVRNKFTCLYDDEEKLENWKYYVRNNKLPIFLSYVLTIDQHNNVKDYCPYIVDDRYSDNEIYGFLNLTKEEIELIEQTLTKFNTVWFKRFKEGKNYKKICDET